MTQNKPRTRSDQFDKRFDVLLDAAEKLVGQAQISTNSTIKEGKTVPLGVVGLIESLTGTLETIRNLYIYKCFLAGDLQKDIAEKFGLSKARISQIIKQVSAPPAKIS